MYSITFGEERSSRDVTLPSEFVEFRFVVPQGRNWQDAVLHISVRIAAHRAVLDAMVSAWSGLHGHLLVSLEDDFLSSAELMAPLLDKSYRLSRDSLSVGLVENVVSQVGFALHKADPTEVSISVWYLR